MTVQQFNLKYFPYIETGFYGLAIDDPLVIDYLDQEFTKEIQSNPNFLFSQIKLKWDQCSVYSNSSRNHEWQSKVMELLNN